MGFLKHLRVVCESSSGLSFRSQFVLFLHDRLDDGQLRVQHWLLADNNLTVELQLVTKIMFGNSFIAFPSAYSLYLSVVATPE